MNVTYHSPASGRLVTVSGTEVQGRYPHLYLWLDTAQGVLRIPREALVNETQFLVCRNCGEAFDSITYAHEHGTADLSGCAGWCGDEGFNIIPESEAF